MNKILLKLLFHGSSRKVPVNMSLVGDGNYTCFLGNHNRNAVAVFTCSDRRSVSCSEILDNIGVNGQGEEASCGIDSVITNDHRSVVKRSLIVEYVS